MSVAGTKAAGDLGAEPSVRRVGVIGNLKDRAVRHALDFAGVAVSTPLLSDANGETLGSVKRLVVAVVSPAVIVGLDRLVRAVVREENEEHGGVVGLLLHVR